MKYKVEKCFQILTDLMTYCHSLGAKRYHLDFHPDVKECEILVQAEIDEIPEEVLEELKVAFEQQRQQEVEEMYWAISYDADSPCEPTLLGMMLDNSAVTYENKILTIRATRKN
jgi:hypothetical protein